MAVVKEAQRLLNQMEAEAQRTGEPIETYCVKVVAMLLHEVNVTDRRIKDLEHQVNSLKMLLT